MSAALRMAEMVEAQMLPDDDHLIVFVAAVLGPIYNRSVTPSSVSPATRHRKRS